MKERKIIKPLISFVTLIVVLSILLFSCKPNIENKKLYYTILNGKNFNERDNSYILFKKNGEFEYLHRSPDKKLNLPVLQGLYTLNDKNFFLKFYSSMLESFENTYKKHQEISSSNSTGIVPNYKEAEKITKSFRELVNFKTEKNIVYSKNDIVFKRIISQESQGRELDGIYIFNIEKSDSIEFLEKEKDEKKIDEYYKKLKNYFVFKLKDNKIYNYNTKTEKFEEYSTYEINNEYLIFNYKTELLDGSKINLKYRLKILNQEFTELEKISEKSKLLEIMQFNESEINSNSIILVDAYYS